MSMAIGYGLSEELKFDEKTGKPLNNNLLDYKLSTFMDHPDLQAEFVENAEPTSPYGTKALGEPPACSRRTGHPQRDFPGDGRGHRHSAPSRPMCSTAQFKEAGLIHDDEGG